MDDRPTLHRALKDRVAELVRPVLDAMGFDLVLVQLTGGAARPTIQIMAERATGEGIGVEECATISRALDAILEQADLVPGRWQLEVSSPGIERPLVRAKDWDRAMGQAIAVELTEPIGGRRRFSGLLEALSEGCVRIRPADADPVAFPLARVRRARLALTPALLRIRPPATAARH